MLTNNDLQKITQIIQTETRKIVQSETPLIVQSETRKIVQSETRKIVQSETRKIVKEELVPVKKSINKLDKKIDLVARVLDRDLMHLRHRVDRVEDHLHLPTLDQN